jgi:hypothetical protein
MTAFERRCRKLLLAYPASYRRDRGEEIIGTLLDATEPGRAWPSPRDARALIAAGLRARVAQNRGLSTAASVRQAALLGAAVYLSFRAAGFLGDGVRETEISGLGSSWLALTAGLLMLATVVLCWLAPRPAVLVAAATATAVAWRALIWPAHGAAIFLASRPMALALGCLLPLTAVAVLGVTGTRPPRSWLWLVALFCLVPLIPDLPQFLGGGALVVPGLYLVPVVAMIAWAVLDARTLLALAVALALFGLAIAPLDGWSAPADLWPLFAVVLAIAAPGLWRLRQRRRTLG